MKFNTVIGNPPYNNDIYLEFIANGQSISKEYLCMITPSKWQTKGGTKNEQFRQLYTKYIKYIVYYPDCLDIFNISEAAGITYFLMDKEDHNKCNIINRNNYQALVNSEEIRSILNGESLWNIGHKIIEKVVGPKYRLNIISEDDRLDYTVNISKMWTGSRVSSGAWDFKISSIKPEFIGKGGVVFNPSGNIKVLGKIRVLNRTDKSDSISSYNIFTTDSLAEMNSFLSWINTKLISFILLMDLASATIITQHAWRNIPEPGNFDHIFTDEEMYKKFQLTEQEILIIESIIK